MGENEYVLGLEPANYNLLIYLNTCQISFEIRLDLAVFYFFKIFLFF